MNLNDTPSASPLINEIPDGERTKKKAEQLASKNGLIKLGVIDE